MTWEEFKKRYPPHEPVVNGANLHGKELTEEERQELAAAMLSGDGSVAKADSGKPKLTLVPRQIIFDIARVREYGTAKYHDPDNWKRVEIERYRDAAFRHFMAYLDDPKGVDAESGLPHLSHLACNIAFLCEMEKRDVTMDLASDDNDDDENSIIENIAENIRLWNDYAKRSFYGNESETNRGQEES